MFSLNEVLVWFLKLAHFWRTFLRTKYTTEFNFSGMEFVSFSDLCKVMK